MTQPEQHATAIESRDAALDSVWEHAPEDWKVRAREGVHTFAGQTITGEDIRLRCEDLGISPHHPNAWGGFVMRLVNEKFGRPLLVRTGQYVAMRGPKSNARVTPLYFVVEDTA